VIRSPNIWDTPDVYELENLASDRAGVIDTTIDALHPLAGAHLLDLGCGTGFHLPRLAARGARVVGVEPHLPLVARARARLARAAHPASTAVVAGDAEFLPMAENSVDVVHARWAYFFGAGGEPGLAEVARVLRPGGRFVASVNHPMRWPFPDSPDPEDLRIVSSYFDRTPYVETDDAGGTVYVEHHRTVGDWVRAVVGAGLVLDDLIEPEWTPGRTQEWGQWSPERGALVPGTLILVCHA
jgi:SAM-dependent methyltransferase